MLKDFNPFALNSYYGSEYFCDRKKELDRLIKNIKNRNSTTLISQRRLGKTLLIQRLLRSLPAQHTGIFIDIFDTLNREDLLNRLATSVSTQIPQKSSMGKKIWDFIRSIQPSLSFDPLTGAPQITLTASSQKSSIYMESIFRLLENQNRRIIIVFDEFQQILKYPETNTDVWLRTLIQQLNNVVFIFSGSRTHLMTELFSNPTRPFYRSTQIMNLGKIDPVVYGRFIKRLFNKRGRQIDKPEIAEILNWTMGHTYYVQALCSYIYDLGDKVITEETIKKAKLEILLSEEDNFMKFRDLLPPLQWKILLALARNGQVFQITSSNFIHENKLGSSASVLRAVTSLIEKDMVHMGNNEEGNRYYTVNDVFFQRWVQWKRF